MRRLSTHILSLYSSCDSVTRGSLSTTLTCVENQTPRWYTYFPLSCQCLEAVNKTPNRSGSYKWAKSYRVGYGKLSRPIINDRSSQEYKALPMLRLNTTAPSLTRTAPSLTRTAQSLTRTSRRHYSTKFEHSEELAHPRFWRVQGLCPTWMVCVEAERQMGCLPLCTIATCCPPFTYPRFFNSAMALQK